ncbi:hypothetical protein HYU20_03295 [Candidatus Woesearchaeota archaeon]|nr:hypothetical protein [Candidatus Woesearchaeota archaeon]
MKQNKPSLGSVVDSLKAYVGEDAAAVIRELTKKNDYSEFKLAEAIGKEVNGTRNLLYKLYSLNLASFIKKKDNKVGWYIHYWTFHHERVGSFLLNEKKNRLELLKELVLKESKSGFYSCSNSCVSVDFDSAFELTFRCPECGRLLNQEKNEGRVRELRNEMEVLEMEVKALEAQKASESEERLGKNKKLEESEEKGKKSRI